MKEEKNSGENVMNFVANMDTDNIELTVSFLRVTIPRLTKPTISMRERQSVSF